MGGSYGRSSASMAMKMMMMQNHDGQAGIDKMISGSPSNTTTGGGGGGGGSMYADHQIDMKHQLPALPSVPIIKHELDIHTIVDGSRISPYDRRAAADYNYHQQGSIANDMSKEMRGDVRSPPHAPYNIGGDDDNIDMSLARYSCNAGGAGAGAVNHIASSSSSSSSSSSTAASCDAHMISTRDFLGVKSNNNIINSSSTMSSCSIDVNTCMNGAAAAGGGSLIDSSSPAANYAAYSIEPPDRPPAALYIDHEAAADNQHHHRLHEQYIQYGQHQHHYSSMCNDYSHYSSMCNDYSTS
jgi:hypothetical protein